jgi:hypothetical protein
LKSVIGRPHKRAANERTARFLTLAADGYPLDLAAKLAGVKAERALRIVSDTPQFWATVDAIKAAA